MRGVTARDGRAPRRRTMLPTIVLILLGIMIVRDIVVVIAWLITSCTLILRSRRNVSRIRSKMTTDSLTE